MQIVCLSSIHINFVVTNDMHFILLSEKLGANPANSVMNHLQEIFETNHSEAPENE